MTTVPVDADRLDELTSAVAELSAELARQREERARWQQSTKAVAELSAELVPIAGPAMDRVTASLAELEGRGYFGFARNGLGVVDRVVTSFTEEDVRALGDNIVLILQAVREMTQPEIMAMVRRTMVTVREDEKAYEAPPSTFALLKQLRDPQVRRGMARLIDTLRAFGGDGHPTAAPASPAGPPTAGPTDS